MSGIQSSSILTSAFLLSLALLNRTLILSYLNRVTIASLPPHAPLFATVELFSALVFSSTLSYYSTNKQHQQQKQKHDNYSLANVGPALGLAVSLLVSHASFGAAPAPVSVPITVLSVVLCAFIIRSRNTYNGDTQLKSMLTLVIAIPVGVIGTVIMYLPTLSFASFLVITAAAVSPVILVASSNMSSLGSWRPLAIAAIMNGFFTVLLVFQHKFVLPSASVNGLLLAINAIIATFAIQNLSYTSNHGPNTSCFLILASLVAMFVDGIPHDVFAVHQILGTLSMPLIVVPSLGMVWLYGRGMSSSTYVPAQTETVWEYTDEPAIKDALHQPMTLLTHSLSPKNDPGSDSDSNEQGSRGGRKRRTTASSQQDTIVDKVHISPVSTSWLWVTLMVSLAVAVLASTIAQHLYVPEIPGADPCVRTLFNENQVQPSPGTHVLVTGGAGFIGSNLAEMLLELGYKVRVMDNLATGSFANIVHLQDNPMFEFMLGDIMNKLDVEKAVEGIEYVYHLAAMSKVVPSLQDPKMAKYCMDNNAGGSFTVLDVCRNKNVKKVIYAASSTYYGNGKLAMQEGDRPDLLTPYASSKYEGEIQMDLFDTIFKQPTVSIRFFMVYGPRQPTTGAYAIVTGVFVNKMQSNTSLPIEGDGTHFRDFIHVRDIGTSLILAQQSSLHSMVINSGTGVGHSVQEVADLVSSNQKYVAPRPHDLVGTLANTCRAKKVLGFKAKYDFVTEMSSMIADAKFPERVTEKPAFKALVKNLRATPWLLPTNSLTHLFSPHIDDLESAAVAATETPDYIHSDVTKGQRQLVVIPFTKATRPLVENTFYTLVKYGQTRSILLVAMTDDDVDECMSMNTACYKAEGVSIYGVVDGLLLDGWTVHVPNPGTAYLRALWPSVTAMLERTGAAMLVPENANQATKLMHYTATPKSRPIFTAFSKSKSGADMYDAYEQLKFICSTSTECAKAAKTSVAISVFSSPYKCLDSDKIPAPETICQSKWAHVMYMDAACVSEQTVSVVSSKLAKVKAWFMAFGTCPEMAERCLGVPRPLMKQHDLWTGDALCLGKHAVLSASATTKH